MKTYVFFVEYKSFLIFSSYKDDVQSGHISYALPLGLVPEKGDKFFFYPDGSCYSCKPAKFIVDSVFEITSPIFSERYLDSPQKYGAKIKPLEQDI